MRTKVLALFLMWVSTFAFSQVTQIEVPERKNDPSPDWEKNHLFPNQMTSTNATTDSVNSQCTNMANWYIPGSNRELPMTNSPDVQSNATPKSHPDDLSFQQIIAVSPGWSGLSAFVVPDDLSVEEIFASYSDQLIILYNQQGTYFPSQQINTLENWNPASGYVAKFAEPADIEFSGQINQNRKIDLALGWNLIPVLSTCPVDVASFFLNKNVRLVKEVSGYKLYWPEMGINSLGELVPGKAYYVLMGGSESVLYPNCGLQTWQCGDPIIDTRDNQSYNTVQIGEQCWMAENLDIGQMIQPSQSQSDNSIIEKYCYNGTQDSCDVYGGLYQWDEMMQYDTIAGRRGICPTGWHLPTDEEWKVLEGSADSQFGYPDPEWDTTGFRGYDAAKNLKSKERWYLEGYGVDLFGFNILPGGNVDQDGLYDNLGAWADFWTSNNMNESGISRDFGHYSNESWRDYVPATYAYSIRCVKNTAPLPWSCGDPLIDTRDNQSYNTVQIGEQCWMAENLDIGHMIEPPQAQSDNSIIEKYCYNGTQDSCDVYGGLYQWNEMMQYDTIAGRRGICPTGWHLPTDEEWKVLEGSADSQFGYPDPVWDSEGYRGFDVGKNLKSVDGWFLNEGGVDLYGFNAKPNGNLHPNGTYENLTSWSRFWTSTHTPGGSTDSYTRNFGHMTNQSHRMIQANAFAYGVRCLQDTEPQPWSCGDPIIDSRDNQSYNTVQIGDQCWMAENMNVGTLITSASEMTDNGIIEKYCHSDSEDSCSIWGAFYQWNEMMKYNLTEGSQGICPEGWHVPDDTEWCELARFVDTTVVCQTMPGITGTDIGMKLKSNGSWKNEGNGLDIYDFNALPSGFLDPNSFCNTGWYTAFWTSSNFFLSSAWDWAFDLNSYVYHDINQYINHGFSVRCLKDSDVQTWSCGDPLIDTRDNQSYNTVQIGEQCWMAENLNVGVQVNPFVQSDNGIIEKLCYNNDPENCIESGGLYEWGEIMNYSNTEFNHGICPDGWHIPAEAEWNELIMGQGGADVAGGKLKEAGFGHWDEPNTGATNESGFTALGTGLFAYDYYGGFRQWSGYWTSSKLSVEPINHFLYYLSEEVSFYSWDPEYHANFNLRCIQTQCPVITTANAGPDQLNVEGNSTILEGNSIPIIEESGEWTIVSGNDGSLSDSSDPHSAFTGNPTESYVLSWAISNICGESDIDTVMISFAPAANSYCGGITELTYDGQVYHTVQIGNQCWLKENLNTGQMINGSTNQTDNSILEKYCYNNEPDSCAEYGGLYQWNELMQYTTQPGAQGICPEGWHIPTSLDACILASFVDEATNCNDPFDILSYTAGGKLKEEGFRHWMDPNDGATNETGFTALGSGANWENSHAFSGIRQYGYYASSTRNTEDYNLGFYMVRVQAHFRKYHSELSRGVSVRCIKDSEPQTWGCGDPILDTRDNQSYNTVQIGDQCWMAENLNVGSRVDGTVSMSNNAIVEKYCNNNEEALCDTYGGLYQWDEAMQYTQDYHGICPAGWHIPINDEFTVLTDYLGGLNVAGGKLKEAGYDHWSPPNTGATNVSGFTALPGGSRSNTPGTFENAGFSALFWSSSTGTTNLVAWYRKMFYAEEKVISGYPGKTYGFSVRCLKDKEPASWNCGDPLLDNRDYQLYNTIQIGDQCWMAENLNIGTTVRTYEPVGPQLNNGIIEKYCYGQIFANCWEYGGLYEWDEMMNYTSGEVNQGICPEGWRVPTLTEWESMISYLGGWSVAGGKMKQTGFTNWNEPNTGATNESGFNGLGCGKYEGEYVSLKQTGNFWTSYFNGENDFLKFISYDSEAIETGNSNHEIPNANSVRCVKGSPPPQPWGCGDPLIDTRDNQSYNTVQIGEQCWMAENLNVGTTINSTLTGYQQTNNETIEKYCYYNDVDNCNVYGGLYEWPEMMQYLMNEGVQGICPDGWHIPSNSEYTALTNFLGTDAGGKMKSTGTIEQGNGLWYEPNEGATNSSGFTGLPGSDEYFSNIGFNGNFWSSSQSGQNTAWYRALGFESVDLESYTYEKNIGLSVRCIKGCPEEPSQANAGPDQINVTGNSVTLTANTPVNYSGFWAVTSGTGGTIVEPSNPASEFIGASGREYTLSWNITTQCGSSVDDVVISFAEFTCGNEFEYDGLSYGTVLIGEQCWMSENLNVGAKINSTSSGSQQLNNGIIEKYCYDNNLAQCNTFGGLYEWNEAMQYSNHEGVQGICLVGWHIPTDAEWTILTNYLGGNNVAGGAMKSTGTLQAGTGLWNSPNTGATNSSSFTGLPGGRRYADNGFFINRNQNGFFWTSTLQSNYYPINPWLRSLSYANTNIMRYEQPGSQGVSIRCLKDCEPQPDQSNAGPNQINVPGISTTLDGNTPSVGTGAWRVMSGTGGIIVDTLNPQSQFQGLPANEYHLTWTISNECGKSVDTVLITFSQVPVPACPEMPTFFYEGKTYNTVKIGLQCWMKENLDVGAMIPSQTGGQLQTNNGIIEKYCYYSNFTQYCGIYGGLYEWNEAMQYVTEEGSQGICPSGWHIPTDWDWLILTEHLGGDDNAGGKMKTMGTLEAGTGLWHDPNSGASDVSGFSGLPVGIREAYNGYLINENYWGYFWSSTQKDAGNAWGQNLDYDATWLKRNNQMKNAGYAVRCIKDCNNPPTQSSAGPDQLNLINTSTVLAANTPSSGTGNWHLESGMGGAIADTSNPVSEFMGLAGSVYSLIWTISTDCGMSKDTVIISFAELTSACPGQPTVLYEGQTYNTVQIGSQCWLKENLNVGTRIDGSGNPTNNGTIEKYCFDDLETNCDIYGGLYTWNEMMQYSTTEGVQGICPPGWHIPTQAQTIMLSNTLGGVMVAGGKMKSTGTIESGTGLWYAPNADATNESNFTGFPGGVKQYYSIDFAGDGYFGYFWTSSQKNSGYAWGKEIQYLSGSITSGANDKNYGFSVRCLRNCSPEPTQAYAGPDQRNIPGTATALTGNSALSGTGEWNLVNGIGGTIADVYNPTSEFSGLASNSYTLTWSINTVCGTSVDTVVISFSTIPSCSGLPFLSYEGQVYHTVQVGPQCWLKENLNVGAMINSSQGGQLQTDNGLVEKFCYENNAANCEIYGGLYEWNEAMQYITSPGAKGICPQGWHIATDSEWAALANYLGGTGVAGGKLKSTGILESGTGLWKSPNTSGTNSSGFTANPGGDRYSTNGSFQGINTGGYFWTSTLKDDASAWYRNVVYSYPDLWSFGYNKAGGFSIRCLKD